MASTFTEQPESLWLKFTWLSIIVKKQGACRFFTEFVAFLYFRSTLPNFFVYAATQVFHPTLHRALLINSYLWELVMQEA